jgi:hypothetical protein
MAPNRKRTYVVAGVLALAAMACVVISSSAEVAYLGFVAAGLFAAAVAILTTAVVRRGPGDH